MAREVGDRFAEAEALRALGDVADDPDAAERARAASVELYRQLGLPEADWSPVGWRAGRRTVPADQPAST